MKIVDRTTFLSLPVGTLFAKVPALPTLDFGPVEIKDHSTDHNNYWYQRLIGDFVGAPDTGGWIDAFEALHKGESRAIDYDILNGDGLYDNDQLFAVFERDDVTNLIERLQAALFHGYSG